MAIELKDLELSVEDFNILYDALLYYPNKDKEGEMIGEMMVSMLADSIPDKKLAEQAHADYLAKRKAEREKREKAKVFLVEQIRFLQAKLVMMKRLLEQEGALAKAKDILGAK